MQFKVDPSGLAATAETWTSGCTATFRTCVLVLLGFTFIAGICWGQNKNTGEIRGTVVDTSGAVIPGAQVVTMNMDTGLQVDRMTDETGSYIAPYLQAGRYSVTVTKDGFKKFVLSNIDVHIDTLKVDATLQVGSVSADVEVSTQQPLLETETSDVSSVLSTMEIEALPNVGADWGTYTALVPGAYPAVWGGGSIPVVGKGWAAQNTGFGGGTGSTSVYLIDGGGATFPVSYNIDYLKEPLGAISEMNTTTSSAGAELSNGEASINLITKSGTNQFHGEASYLVQNDFFNAMSRYWGTGTPPAKQRLNWQQYDLAIGGPIIHDRLFFFFDFQHQHTSGTNTFWETFPNDAIRGGDFSGLVNTWAALGHNVQVFDPAITGQDPANPGNPNFATRSTCGTLVCNNKVLSLDPVAVAIQKYFPEPNAQQDPLDPYTNNYYYQVADPKIQKWFTYKGTGNIASSHQINISGMTTIYSDAENSYIPELNNNPESINEMSQQVSDVWTISPTKLNEFRASLVREGAYWSSPALNKGIAKQIGLPGLIVDTFPAISFATGSTGNFSGQGSPFIAKLVQDGLQIADNFNWILGKHTVKIGAEYNNWTDNSGWGTNTPGGFNFDGTSTRDPRESPASCSSDALTCSSNGISYADFLLGRVQSYSNTLIEETGGRNYTFQFYGQDYYKISSKLTVNFGLRFLHQPGWTEEYNRFSTFDPTVVNSADGTLGGLSFPGLNGAPRSLLETKHFVAPRGGFAWELKSNWALHGGTGIYMVPWGANAYYNNGIGQGFDPYSTPTSTDPHRMSPMLQLQDGPLPMVYPTSADLTSGMKNYSDQAWIPRDTPIAYSVEWNLGLQHQLGNYVVELGYIGNRGVNQSHQINGNSVQPNQLGDMSKIPYPNYNALWKSQWNGWSNYDAMQLQARRQFAAGYSFEATWTWSHMLDTGTALGASAPGTSDWQQAFCVACNYGNAANDFRHNLQAHGVYQLPWGKGRKFANKSWLSDATIGGWQASGIFNLRSGFPETPTSYVNPLGQGNGGSWSGAPWPMRVQGQKVRLSHRTVQEWFNTKAFSVTPAYTFGNGGRDVVVGPRFWDFDFSAAKSWSLPRLGEKTNFQFKWDTYDLFNHPNYNPPDTSIGDTNFGKITSDQGTQRSMMFSGILRF